MPSPDQPLLGRSGSSKRSFIRPSVTLLMALPPVLAIPLYFSSSRTFASNHVHNPGFANFVGVSCVLAELALFEVKTMKFAQQISKALLEFTALKSAAERWAYLKKHRSAAIKHALLLAISVEASVVYYHLSIEAKSKPFFAFMTFLAKYTTFHNSLDGLIAKLSERLNLPDRNCGQHASYFSGLFILGVIGSMYVYGKADETYLELGAAKAAAVVLAMIAMLPTIFLTGTCLISFKDAASTLKRPENCKPKTVLKIAAYTLRFLIFLWLAFAAAAPNAHFMESWGKGQEKIGEFTLFCMTITVLLLSLLTKYDSLPITANYVYETVSRSHFFRPPPDSALPLHNVSSDDSDISPAL